MKQFTDLSPPRAHLLRMCQELNFGRLENIQIRGGNPVFNPAPVAIREVKFGGDNLPRPERQLSNFVLREEAAQLMALLDNIGDGFLDVLTVKHGTPFSAQCRASAVVH